MPEIAQCYIMQMVDITKFIFLSPLKYVECIIFKFFYNFLKEAVYSNSDHFNPQIKILDAVSNAKKYAVTRCCDLSSGLNIGRFYLVE